MASSQPYMHRTFKEIKIHTAKCDQCNKHNTATIYRCEDCSEQCCTPCWNQQGDDGKHLLNNALTVVIPANEADKKRSAKKKPAKVVKTRGKKTAITYRKIAKKPLQRKREIVDDDDDDDDDDLDDSGDDSALGHGPAKTATIAYPKTREKRKQSKSQMPAPDLYQDSSNPDIEYRPASHPKVITQKPIKPVAGRLLATGAVKGLPIEGTEHVQSKNDVVVHEGDTTDDDMPVCHIPPKATSQYSKGILKVSNANKRKRSEPSSADRIASRDDHAASNRKKLRTSTRRNTALVVDASSCPQAPASDEEVSFSAVSSPDRLLIHTQTEADIREHARNLLLFAQGVQHSSPTPSPPLSKTASLADVQVNTRFDLTDTKKARSSSPFADLPLWPPAPALKTAAASSTPSPSHHNYERATAPQAQTQTSTSPVPRDCISNKPWSPTVRHRFLPSNPQSQRSIHRTPHNIPSPYLPTHPSPIPNSESIEQNPVLTSIPPHSPLTSPSISPPTSPRHHQPSRSLQPSPPPPPSISPHPYPPPSSILPAPPLNKNTPPEQIKPPKNTTNTTFQQTTAGEEVVNVQTTVTAKEAANELLDQESVTVTVTQGAAISLREGSDGSDFRL